MGSRTSFISLFLTFHRCGREMFLSENQPVFNRPISTEKQRYFTLKDKIVCEKKKKKDCKVVFHFRHMKLSS